MIAVRWVKYGTCRVLQQWRGTRWDDVPTVALDDDAPAADERQKWPVAVPPIGQPWRGGIYAGTCRGAALFERDYHLIVSAEEIVGQGWEYARRWAVDCYKLAAEGWSLPSRREQSMLFANVPELFAKEWYWSGEKYGSDPIYAWAQNFDNGRQGMCLLNEEFRARAVRRIPLGDEHGR